MQVKVLISWILQVYFGEVYSFNEKHIIHVEKSKKDAWETLKNTQKLEH